MIIAEACVWALTIIVEKSMAEKRVKILFILFLFKKSLKNYYDY